MARLRVEFSEDVSSAIARLAEHSGITDLGELVTALVESGMRFLGYLADEEEEDALPDHHPES